MTSASGLFHSRRYRFGRTGVDLDLDSGSDPKPYDSHGDINRVRRSHLRHDDIRHQKLDGFDSSLRKSHKHPRVLIHRALNSELKSSRSDQDGCYSASARVGTSCDRPLFGGNRPLPGAVLLARERLLQRLRGVSLSGNRRSATPDIHQGEFAFTSSFIDNGDWETESSGGWPVGVSYSPNLNSISLGDHQLMYLQEKGNRPALTQGTVNCLKAEASSKTTEVDGDCSICLESLMEGDELISLRCQHRFHSSCLRPWILTRSECPYCRAGVTFFANNNSYRAGRQISN